MKLLSSKTKIAVIALLFFLKNNSYAQMVINEVSNNNGTAIYDEAGKAPDWIELYNPGASPVNLSNYSISDDSTRLDKWVFPNLVINAKSYLLLFASGNDTVIGNFLHLNFKLDKDGETIFLSDANRILIDCQKVSILHIDHSAGRGPDGSTAWCIFGKVTPGKTNGTNKCYKGYEPEPVFSLNAGFYPGAQSISLTAGTATGQIRYTLTGDEPGSSNTAYTAPVKIEETHVLAARTYSSDPELLPSNTVKKTYFINEGALDLPVVSISTNPGNLWDYNSGMYVSGPNASSDFPYMGSNFWQDWERLCHIEYFDKQKKKQFETDAGLSIYGGWSRAYPQKSFKINCEKKYGDKEVKYPLIPDKGFITSYENIILRNAGQDMYGSRFRDAFMQRVVKEKNKNVDYLGYEPALLFLNGKYWGEYEIRESHSKKFFEKNYGISPDKVDVLIHAGRLKIKAGSDEHFWKMFNYIKGQDAKGPSFYGGASQYLDIENYKDYFITELYYGNKDWLNETNNGNNILLWHPRTPTGKWRYMLWDIDQGMDFAGSSASRNSLSILLNRTNPNPHADLFEMMLKNNQFKNEFINRFADLINTIFQPDNMKRVMYPMRDSIASSMPRHIKKWGKSMSDWNKSIESMLSFNTSRINYMRNYIEGQFKLQDQVDVTLKVYPENAGSIKISTIIPDSLPWTGVYFDGVPVGLTAIPAPGYVFRYWQTHGMMNTSDTSNAAITLNIGADNTFIAHFAEDHALAVHTPKDGLQFIATPNPSNNVMTIDVVANEKKWNGSSFRILDAQGKQILHQEKIHPFPIVLKKEDFASGMYMLILSNERGELLTEKIVFE